jgi:hypothetical protein
MLKLAPLLLLLLLLPDGRRGAVAVLRALGVVWRPGAGLFAVLALTAAAVLAVREDWWAAAILALAAGGLALAARRRPPRPPPPAASPASGMSVSEARAILGVPDGAGRADVEAAYRRLIRLAHPDQGGTAGLAAQLNAARAVLARSVA